MLRFSRLFKPNKSSRLPKVWRNVKTKRKKRKHSDAVDYNSFDNDSKKQIVCLEFGSMPEPEFITCDDEVIVKFIFYCVHIINFSPIIIFCRKNFYNLLKTFQKKLIKINQKTKMALIIKPTGDVDQQNYGMIC